MDCIQQKLRVVRGVLVLGLVASPLVATAGRVAAAQAGSWKQQAPA